MDEKKEEEFTVRDRRTFPSDSASSSSEPGAGSAAPDSSRPEQSAGDREKTAPPPELDFSGFIFSLATTAQVSLGALPDPQTSLTAQNLPAAKQMIDIIGIIKDKTKGNLTAEEQALVDAILFNLRMQYVKTVEGKK